jgi:nucleotide-binding universal stress UspA family protein
METLHALPSIQVKNILFATDFSPAATSAAAYAAEIAKHYGAKLFAFHVRPPVINPMTPPAGWKAEEKAAKLEEEQQRRELLRLFREIRPEILIEEGDLWSNLKGVIETNKIDLIVIGTRGRSGIGKFLLGSTAEEIFREAPCPVLTVGPRTSDARRPNGEFKKILFATDFTSESMAAAPYAISLAQEYQAYLTLVHVVEEPKTGELVQSADLITSSERLLRDLVPEEAKLWCVPEYVVERGVPADKILDVAASRESELIVLGVRRPSGVPGAATHLPIAIAHKVVSHALCPVLTVRN